MEPKSNLTTGTSQKVLRWVKASERLPEKDGQICVRSHGVDYSAGWVRTRRDNSRVICSMATQLSEWPSWRKNLEWLEEIEIPTAFDMETYLHMDMPEYLKDGRDKGRFSWEEGYKAVAMRFSKQQPKETPSPGEVALIAFINKISPSMAEQYQRHDYRSMWGLWEMLVEEAQKPQSHAKEAVPARQGDKGWHCHCGHFQKEGLYCDECGDDDISSREDDEMNSQQGEMPEDVHGWILLQADELYDEGEHQQDFISGMTTMYHRDQEQIKELEDKINYERHCAGEMQKFQFEQIKALQCQTSAYRFSLEAIFKEGRCISNEALIAGCALKGYYPPSQPQDQNPLAPADPQEEIAALKESLRLLRAENLRLRNEEGTSC